ncbi:hypothetical protein E1293_20495 [Actinomadura darangshiensis]|uniref:Uncharacterized protein n=1 Tax=Actinomadura darangshiensis TaxID=705336 RepID=A0A4R5B6R5_9ACTN|nr:hypothetical protein [Actinomadura darangshiensis]TDD80569.1 hypothetical protein E1293_20495 [Actinomadura darangshiensis]
MAQPSLAGILRSRIATVLALLAGLAAVALTAYFVATEAPDGTRDLDAYNAAPRCPAAPSKPSECRWTQKFTVSEIHLTHKRGKLDRAILTDTDGGEWETAYVNRRPVLTDLTKGDRITGTIWRGRVTAIAAGGESQDTDAAPDDLRTRYLIGALLVIPPALLISAACVWRLSRRAPTPGMAAALGLAIALFFAGLFVPFLARAAGERLWAVAAIWLPLAAVLTIAARIYVVRQRARPQTASPREAIP